MRPGVVRILITVLLLTGLLSACGGGRSARKGDTSTHDSRLEQDENRSRATRVEEDEETAPPREAVHPASPAPATALTNRPREAPRYAPYRPADLSKLPTTLHRPDHSVMVLVPDGSYLVTQSGSQPTGFAGGGSLYPYPLKAFYIDRNEITVEQFRKRFPQYNETVYTDGKPCPKCPAMGVTLMEAKTYCAGAGKKLPTEAQWEAAGRGRDNQPYPWGRTYDAKRANLAGGEDGAIGPAEVSSYPLGASDFGAMDMIGNVWEWVDTGETAPTLSSAAPAPGSGETARVALPVAMKGRVKGGGYRSRPKTAILSARHEVPAGMRNPTFGFRCVKPFHGTR